MNTLQLQPHHALRVRQRHEIAEWIGYETRNKYEIYGDGGQLVAYAAEQQKGFFNFIVRQWLGHWRTFDVLFFSPDRRPVLRAHHPFRFFFQRLEVYEDTRFLGAVQRRFAILTKRFDVEDARGNVLMRVSSPFWRLWTFPFERHGRQVAQVAKRWSGVLSELLTDKDNFAVEFSDPAMQEDERKLILAAALFIDLQYFENKA
jgi:uncharacterized protein YxjI